MGGVGGGAGAGAGFAFFGLGIPTPVYRTMSRRVERTVRIAHKQARVSKEALRMAEEKWIILCMILVVPAHLDGKPASGVQQALPRSAQIHGGSQLPTDSNDHPSYRG